MSMGYSSNGHFADHNYSLPKTNPLIFRTPSFDDFRPFPSPKLPNFPCPLFVDVDAPLALERPASVFRKKKYKIFKRPIVPQRINSADDFRVPLPKYVPRPLFVDVTAPLGPRPNLSGVPSGQKNRSVATTSSQPAAKPVQTQPATNSKPTQVRLGSAITLTQNNGAKPSPPPAHVQKPSISIIPQPASTRAVTNVAITKPPPYVPSNTGRVQNPLNLMKNVHNVNLNQNLAKNIPNSNKNQPSKLANMLQKAQTQVQKITSNSFMGSKNASTSEANKIAQKIITPPPPRRVAVPLSRVIAPAPPTPPQLNKIVVPPPLSMLTAARAPPTTDPLFIPITTSWTNVSSATAPTTTTSPATPSNQQSPLQKQMRNFMEHLHQLQQKMKDTDEDGVPNLGDSNNGRVWNATGNKNQGTPPADINTSRINARAGAPIPPHPSRTLVKVGSKTLSPVIGGVGTTNVTRLNAARNLSNITKTYQRAKDNNVAGATATTPSTSQSSNRPNVRVIGSLPTPPVTSTNTLAPTTTVLPNNISFIVDSNANGTTSSVRKIIRNSPKGAARPTVINPVVGHTTNGTVPRVITRVVESNAARAKPKVNPVTINGNIGTNASQASRVPGGGNTNIRVVPVTSAPKKMVISEKDDAQRNNASVQNLSSPIRVDLLQKKMMSNLNRLSIRKVPPKSSSPQRVPRPLPSLPQRSFVNGAGMRTYEARKNTPPSRANSLPSLSISQPGASVSKSNKENRTNRKLLFGTNNNNTSTDNSTMSVDLSNEENSGNTTGASISKEMVNTLRKKGVSINYLGKDVINLD